MFYILLFFFVTIIYGSSSQNKTHDFDNDEFVPRVVNGWAAKLGDVPYQIAFKTKLHHRNLCMTFCGGVILTPIKLLSAAHCFAKDQNFCEKLCGSQGSKKALSHVYAVAGNLRNHDFYGPDSLEHGQWRNLRTLIFPKTYKFPKDDIAILFTRKPFIFNDNINSIPFASKFTDYHGKCLVSGFGRISKRESSSKLLLAHLDLMPLLQCNNIFRKNMRKFVCTSTIVTDVGKGDSGGPLVCMGTGDPNESGKGVLVGIVSGNKRRAGSFFTRVSYFSKYIERNKSFQMQPGRIYIINLLIYAKFLLL